MAKTRNYGIRKAASLKTYSAVNKAAKIPEFIGALGGILAHPRCQGSRFISNLTTNPEFIKFYPQIEAILQLDPLVADIMAVFLSSEGYLTMQKGNVKYTGTKILKALQSLEAEKPDVLRALVAKMVEHMHRTPPFVVRKVKKSKPRQRNDNRNRLRKAWKKHVMLDQAVQFYPERREMVADLKAIGKWISYSFLKNEEKDENKRNLVGENANVAMEQGVVAAVVEDVSVEPDVAVAMEMAVVVENVAEQDGGMDVPKDDAVQNDIAEIEGPQEVQTEELPEELIKNLEDHCDVLTKKQNEACAAIYENRAKAEDIKTYRELSVHMSLHNPSIPGITSLDINESDTNLVVTGGNDKHVVVFNREANKKVATLKGHHQAISDVIYHPDLKEVISNLVISSSLDNTIMVWSVEHKVLYRKIKPHKGPITGISLQATGEYLLSISEDKKWAFSNIKNGSVLCKVADPVSSQAMTCVKFHPGGMFFGTGGADALVKIWDLRTAKNEDTFSGHAGTVRSISFAGDWLYAASVADDAVIKIWDLRAVKFFKSIELPQSYKAKDLSIDKSGSYIAVAGTDVRIYRIKHKEELVVLKPHTLPATKVRFGENATFIASSSLDKSLRFYGLHKPENI